MSLFSTIDHVPDGQKKLESIFKTYDLHLTEEETNVIKYGPLGDRYSPYIPKVSKKEHRLLKELMTKERAGIFSISKGKKKWAPPPGSHFKTPDKIILKYGKKEYKFSEDDLLKNVFTRYFQHLFFDYHNDEITLPKNKQHYFKSMVMHLIEYLRSITSTHNKPLSANRILHLVYDVMALSYPQDFNTDLNHDDDQDKNRYKAARIRSIIK